MLFLIGFLCCIGIAILFVWPDPVISEYRFIVSYGDERLNIRVKATSKYKAKKIAKATFKGCYIN